jgi:methionyl-tRNA synthetase
MKPKNIFIGVAWPYVNGDLHIGHLAGYLFPSDIFARFHRFLGNQVLMVSGSDCFGTPITVEADKRGITPEALIAEYHPRNVALFSLLKLSFDNYTLTATENHRRVTQEFFLAMLRKNLLTKGKTQQYFSAQENRFLPDRYVEGTCPFCGDTKSRSDQCDKCTAPIKEGELINPLSRNTGSPVELKETEHYFIDWPKLQPFLTGYFEKTSSNWRPWIRSETLKWLKEGLQPRAITRDLEWGVEIPADRIPKEQLIDHHEHKRIYVWFDAVIGYLSAAIEWAEQVQGRSWEQFWKDPEAEHVYFMGKDNLVFHTIFWPGQLHSYDETLHLPDNCAINQFLNLEGQKFSKSRGVIVDSREIVEQYGLDPVRFYMASINPEHADANFAWDDFITKTNSVLIGNVGNFINRCLKLSEKIAQFDSAVLEPEILAEVDAHIAKAKAAFGQCSLREAIETTLSLSAFGNKYITVKAPWSIKDKSAPEFVLTMTNCLYVILSMATLLKPVIPDTIERLQGMLGVELDRWPSEPRAELGALLQRIKISQPTPLFARVEPRSAPAPTA